MSGTLYHHVTGNPHKNVSLIYKGSSLPLIAYEISCQEVVYNGTSYEISCQEVFGLDAG